MHARAVTQELLISRWSRRTGGGEGDWCVARARLRVPPHALRDAARAGLITSLVPAPLHPPRISLLRSRGEKRPAAQANARQLAALAGREASTHQLTALEELDVAEVAAHHEDAELGHREDEGS